MRNGLYTFTGASAANSAKTHTISKTWGATTGTKKYIGIRSLTVSTSGADLASDVTVAIKDNGTTVWSVELRSGKVFGGHFRFDDYPILIKAGDCTIETDAGGALCVVTVSSVYSVQ